MVIADLGSLSQASDRLHIAQTALSRHIQILEHEIGVELFFRHHRGMSLTAAGENFLTKIGVLVTQLEQTLDDVRASSGISSGKVTLGMTPTVSTMLAGRLARRVAIELPQVALRIVEAYGGHQVEWLQRGELDIIIVYGPATAFHMQITELLYEELVLVGPAGSLLDPAVPIAFGDLAKLNLVLPSMPHGLRRVIERAAAKARIKLPIRVEADSFHVLLDLVEKDLGYTVLPLSAIGREIREGRLRYAPFSGPALMRQMILGLPVNSNPTPATQHVVHLVKDEIRQLVTSGVWDAQLQLKPEAPPLPNTLPLRLR